MGNKEWNQYQTPLRGIVQDNRIAVIYSSRPGLPSPDSLEIAIVVFHRTLEAKLLQLYDPGSIIRNLGTGTCEGIGREVR